MFGWRSRVPTVLQFQAAECGIAALSMLMAFHGCLVPLEELRRVSGLSGEGSSLALLKRLAGHYGFHARVYRKEPEALPVLGFPCMAFVNFNHMVVVEGMASDMVRVNDPDGGRHSLSMAEFDRAFTGIALRLEPGPQMRPRASCRPGTLFALIRSRAWWWAGVLLLALACGGAEIMVARGLDQGRAGDLIPPLIVFVAAAGACHALLWAAAGRLRADATKFVNDRLFSRSASFFGYRGVATMAHVAGLPSGVGQWARGVAGSTAVGMVSGLVALVALAWLSPPVALASVATWGLSALATARVYLAPKSAWRRKISQRSGLGLGDVMTCLDPWQSACRDEDILAAETAAALRGMDRDQHVAVEGAALRGIIAATTAAAFLLAMWISPGWTVPALVLLACRWWFHMPKAMPAFLALRQMNEAFDDLAASPAHRPLQPAQDKGPLLHGDGLTFGYGAVPLFQAVTLTADAGAVIGLGGGVGAGKSTLARLLTGQLIPDTGSVHLRGRAVLVPTMPVLFNASVADNVTCWRPGLDAARVEWALRIACLWDDVVIRPGSLDALVDSEGGNFSGGQQRRLMLARALVDTPDLLILDETLDAVDPDTEKRIFANLRRAGVTVIVISQRRETLALCDRAWRLTAAGCVPLERDQPHGEPDRDAVALTKWTPNFDHAAIAPETWKALAAAAAVLGVILPDCPAHSPCPPHQNPLDWQARLHGLLLLPVMPAGNWPRGGPAVLLARWRAGGEAVLVPGAFGGYRYWQVGQGWRRLDRGAAMLLEPSALAVCRRTPVGTKRIVWLDFMAALAGALAVWLGACGVAAGSPAGLVATAVGTIALVLARQRCRSRLHVQGTVESVFATLRLSAWWTRHQSEVQLLEWSQEEKAEMPDGFAAFLALIVSLTGIGVVAALSAGAIPIVVMAAGAAVPATALSWQQAAAADRARPPRLAARLLLNQILLLMASITGTPVAQTLRERWATLRQPVLKVGDRQDCGAAGRRLWRLFAPLLAAVLGAALLPSTQVPFMVLAAWAGLGLGDGAAALLRVWRRFRRRRPFRQAPRENVGQPPSQPARDVTAEGVSFAYDRPLLTDVSLSVAPGEIVAIAGPSGCGKSTLLRLLLGAERPQGGRICWNGCDLAESDRMAYRAHAAAVFQDEPMPLDLLHAQVRGGGCMDLDQVVAILVAVGLWPKVASMPMGLASLADNRMFSTGQAAQLMLARALVRAPRILFLDETLSALDPPTQRRVLALIRSHGITCILTSHQDAVLAQADRVLRLEDGRLRPEEVRTRAMPSLPAENAEAALPAPFGDAARLYRGEVLARLAAKQRDDILPHLAPAPLVPALTALIAAALGVAG